ncbi:MAG TPA: lytic transglycosylase domain-containing protein [Longimicrobiales bacterium]|nr:lytic transglycosylase domain-containing protein [Longimicrobiales bacterium]
MAAPRPNDRRIPPPPPPPQERRENEGKEDPGRRSARQIFQRIRQPMIGLGMAGAAIPMVNASNVADRAKATNETEQAGMNLHAGADSDTEDRLAEQIAATQEQQEREQHVAAAVARYDIGRDLAEDIYDIAREEDIEPALAFGLVKTESTFDERARSHVGARGLTQVMPRTAAWLVPGTKTEDLYDRQTNLRLGFKYLDQMIDKYKGNVRLALLAYNRGPGTVDKVLKRGGDPNNGYADKVLRGD